jgi:hypothetical protein
MHSHPNARLTQKGRLHRVTHHLEHGCSLIGLAADQAISFAVPIDGWPVNTQAVWPLWRIDEVLAALSGRTGSFWSTES